jgi:hypothetical protein
MTKCNHCNTVADGNFCPQCGHPKELVRINGRYIISQVASVLNFQKGILYTIKELIIRPGKSVKTFIKEDRNRLVKPIMFLLVCSLIYTLALSIFSFEDGYMNYEVADSEMSTSKTILQWIGNNYGYSNIMMAVFITLWLKLFFRKYKYNFYEIFILLCFIMGMMMLLFAFFGILESLIDFSILQYGAMLGMIYAYWAIGSFFDGKKKRSYVKSFFAYGFGMMTFLILAIGVGIGIDLIFVK